MNDSEARFDRALDLGRPPTVRKLFPHSRTLLVSGRYIDRAMIEKGGAAAVAVNGRSDVLIRGALRAAQRAGACLIIEIARCEGGPEPYCATSYWNLARHVDALGNELGITVPVAVHADHFGVASAEEIAAAKVEIPTLFEAGVTSIAIDASRMSEAENLLANLELAKCIPAWAGFETEVGEIKGDQGLTTPEEALFHVKGLNAHGVFPDWIALNNGSVHGIEAGSQGIRVDLTAKIHAALAAYGVSGAQHGTSGNDSIRLRELARQTRTTKANVATALQMISWGVDVDEFGNAMLDENEQLVKIPGRGVTEELWSEMVACAGRLGLAAGGFEQLNLPFENKIMAQPQEIRERMIQGVEEFAFELMANVFNAGGTAEIAIEKILSEQSHDPGPKAASIEDPADWTPAAIAARAAAL